MWRQHAGRGGSRAGFVRASMSDSGAIRSNHMEQSYVAIMGQSWRPHGAIMGPSWGNHGASTVKAQEVLCFQVRVNHVEVMQRAHATQ